MSSIFSNLTVGLGLKSEQRSVGRNEKKRTFGATAFDFSTFSKTGGSGKKALKSRTGAEEAQSYSESEEEEDVSSVEDSDQESGRKSKPKTFKNTDQVNEFRNSMRIKVKGGESVVNPVTSFAAMDMHASIKEVICANVEKSEWKEPTPIQMQAIPTLLSGRDVLAAAPTGSGKTAAFVIPALSSVATTKFGVKRKSMKGNIQENKEEKKLRGLLLAPTRELAEQIHREAERLCQGKRLKIYLLKKDTVNGGHMGQSGDKSAFKAYDIIVSTPMRLLGLVRAGAIDLSGVRFIALDEADKLFELNKRREGTGRDHRKSKDSGNSEDSEEEGEDEGLAERHSAFLNQVDEILAECPRDGSVQRALFSATIGPFVSELAAQFLHNHVHITVGTENAGNTNIKQILKFVGREDGKLLAIRQIVQEGIKPPVLLFLQSVERAKALFKELVYDGINVDVIHAEKSAKQREEVIRRFRQGDIWVLICTDLMARGVDFKGVQMVINYDLPQSAVAYIHRIGRTGRAGQEGTAVTLFTEDDIPQLRPIANVIKLSGGTVPEWMLSIPKLNTKKKRQLRQSAPERRSISTSCDYDKGQKQRKLNIIAQSKGRGKKGSGK